MDKRNIEKLTTSYFDIGNNSLMFGIPIKELTREELISCIGYLSSKIENQRNDYHHNLHTLSEIIKK
jgi:hypothetical protein